MYIDSLSIAGFLVALSAAIFFVMVVRKQPSRGRRDDSRS